MSDRGKGKPLRKWPRKRVVAAGAVVGAAAGLLVLEATPYEDAYTNDAYREGVHVGIVFRYIFLGALAAVLVSLVARALQQRARRRWPLAVALTAILAAGVLPPQLDEQSPSERRRSEAIEIEDPWARTFAEERAGTVDGCVTSVRLGCLRVLPTVGGLTGL